MSQGDDKEASGGDCYVLGGITGQIVNREQRWGQEGARDVISVLESRKGSL